jgi:hypothetical protein
VLDLLTILNSQHESIKFTYEMEKDGNSMLHRAISIPMTKEDRQAELNYIYETAHLNGFAREPIEKLAIKQSNRQRIR